MSDLSGEELKEMLAAQKRTPKVCRLSLQGIEQICEIIDRHCNTDQEYIKILENEVKRLQQNAKPRVTREKLMEMAFVIHGHGHVTWTEKALEKELKEIGVEVVGE